MEDRKRSIARSTTMAGCSKYSDKKEVNFPGKIYAAQTIKLVGKT